MATYRVTSPDGTKFKVTAPDDATEEQVLAYAQQQFSGAADRKKASDEELRKMADPTGSFGQNMLAGAGKFFNDVGTGLGQRLGLVSQDDAEEQRRLDAPLMKTGGGVTGNIAAGVTALAPTALIPGANTVAGAATIGGITGALQPFTSWVESLLNPALGAAGGAAGQQLANWAGGKAEQRAMEAAKMAAQNAQKVDAAKSAARAGYVIPPADLPNASKTIEAVSGLSGKIKTAQEASARNQQVTNRLVRQALGLAEDAPLTRDTLIEIRKNAGQAYEAFKNIGQIESDDQFKNALDAIATKYQGASRSFPDVVKNDPVLSLVEGLKAPQAFDAADAIEMTKVLRERADDAFRTGQSGVGGASKKAADAIEDALERHLKATGDQGLLEAFRAARREIAKTYTVQKGLNSQTGDVSAHALAKELTKGKPLSGELLTVAKTGEAFKKATQLLPESPKALSPLDWAAAMTALAGSGGNPLSAAGLVARPGARAALLSQPVQRRMIERASQAPAVNPLLNALSYEQANIPAGILSGEALASYLAQQNALQR